MAKEAIKKLKEIKFYTIQEWRKSHKNDLNKPIMKKHIEKKLDTIKSIIDELENEINELENEVDILSDKNSELESEIEELKYIIACIE